MKTQETTASMKRHMGLKAASRVSNTLIHIILVIISVIWLIPFVCIVIQSFRTEPTTMSRYLLNHPTIEFKWGLCQSVEIRLPEMVSEHLHHRACRRGGTDNHRAVHVLHAVALPLQTA